MSNARKSVYVVSFVLLGALLVLQTLGTLLGWSGRAPDVVYGDEMNFSEEILLLFVAIELYRRNSRAKFLAAVLAVLNGVAVAVQVDVLAKPIAFAWAAMWTVVFAAASWSSIKRFVLDATKKRLKTA
jgi:hypothetical protein